jgi:hypothetical protein
VTKQYQTIDLSATEVAVPESVSVAMAEIAEDMQEGLLALGRGCGPAGDGLVDGRRRGCAVWAVGSARFGASRDPARQ